MMMRVSKSAALAKWNNGMMKMKILEDEIAKKGAEKTKDEKVIEVCRPYICGLWWSYPLQHLNL
jgi:hypothetical protein